ncbi:MAG: nucleoside 2-deoxyribosyltransferase [Polyangiales bacterium]
MPRIYCSGPLFCAEEVGGMTAIAQTLERAGLDTFLPHRDGLEPYVLRFGDSAATRLLPSLRARVDYAIFALDVYELLERCDAVVCNLNGRVPDEGMIVEASLAFAIGKPVVLYKADARAPFGGHDNAMLTALARGAIESRMERLPSKVTQAIDGQGTAGTPAPALARAVADGARIAGALAKLPVGVGKQRWPEDVVERVIAAVGDG